MDCPHCVSRNTWLILKRSNVPSAVYELSPSENTVTTPCGLTITWSYFLTILPKPVQLPIPGNTASLRSTNSRLAEQGISLVTPQKNSRLARTVALKAVKNPNSRRGRQDPDSALSFTERSFRHIARAVLPTYKRTETSPELFALADRYIQYLGRSSTKPELGSEYRSVMQTDSSMTGTTSNTLTQISRSKTRSYRDATR